MNEHPVHILILAGGTGARMGSDIPKQFLPLADKPVLRHTLDRCHDALPNSDIFIVVHPDWLADAQKLVEKLPFANQIKVTAGGKTRFHSVLHGLDILPEEESLVAVHDGVRPLVTKELILETVEKARETGSAIPLIPLKDSIRQITGPNTSHQIDRTSYRLVQTPQTFYLPQLRKAYERPYEPTYTDDASVWEAAGGRVSWVEGNNDNVKITTQDDLAMAEALLNKVR